MSEARPNILFVITDQQSADTIALLRKTGVSTPGFDRLARRGVSFGCCYSSNPLCSPARSTMFTGRASCETGVYVNGKGIREGMPTMGEWFREHGDYETLYAGKWHVPACYTQDIPGFRVISTGIGHQGTVSDPVLTEACANWLYGNTGGKPFLMVAGYMQPHDICEWLRLNRDNTGTVDYPEDMPPLPDNYEPIPDDELDMISSMRANQELARGGWDEKHCRYYLWSYLRHIEMVDGEVNRLLDVIEETGQLENTVVVLTSDHGEGCGRHQMTRKNFHYDDVTRVPFLFSSPRRIVENKIDAENPTSHLDIFPTLCGLADLPIPEGVRGCDLTPLLTGRAKRLDRRYVASEVRGNLGQMIRSERYKYLAEAGDGEMLFDMQDDPGEMKNLLKDPAHAEALAEHRGMLKEWIESLDIDPRVPEEARWAFDS